MSIRGLMVIGLGIMLLTAGAYVLQGGKQRAVLDKGHAFQMITSPIWLRHFRFGPMEWLWRSLTYWKRQPMRRA